MAGMTSGNPETDGPDSQRAPGILGAVNEADRKGMKRGKCWSERLADQLACDRGGLRVQALRPTPVTPRLMLLGRDVSACPTLSMCGPIRTGEPGEPALLSYPAGPSTSKQAYC
jgi:hypothetical protein